MIAACDPVTANTALTGVFHSVDDHPCSLVVSDCGDEDNSIFSHLVELPYVLMRCRLLLDFNPKLPQSSSLEMFSLLWCRP